MSSRMFRAAAMASVLFAATSNAANQEHVLAEPVPVAEETSLQTAAALPPIPAGTPVIIEIAEPLASSTHVRGQVFAITLAKSLVLDGVERLPRGTRGTGEIVHAAAARGGGAPGELLISARTLETPQGQLQLRGFKLGATGDDNSGMALGISTAIGPFAMFIRGREIQIPAGTRGIAKTKAALPPPSAESGIPMAMPDTSSEAPQPPISKTPPPPAFETSDDADAGAQPPVSSQPEIPVQSKE